MDEPTSCSSIRSLGEVRYAALDAAVLFDLEARRGAVARGAAAPVAQFLVPGPWSASALWVPSLTSFQRRKTLGAVRLGNSRNKDTKKMKKSQRFFTSRRNVNRVY